jgi:hypothetical protein
MSSQKREENRQITQERTRWEDRWEVSRLLTQIMWEITRLLNKGQSGKKVGGKWITGTQGKKNSQKFKAGKKVCSKKITQQRSKCPER